MTTNFQKNSKVPDYFQKISKTTDNFQKKSKLTTNFFKISKLPTVPCFWRNHGLPKQKKVDTFIYIIGHKVVFSLFGKGEVSNKYCVLWWLVVGSFWHLNSLIDQLFRPASSPLIPTPSTLLSRLYKALLSTNNQNKTNQFYVKTCGLHKSTSPTERLSAPLKYTISISICRRN